jgi:hypothetical protein
VEVSIGIKLCSGQLIGITLSWGSVIPANNLLCLFQFIENTPALGVTAKPLPIKERRLAWITGFRVSDAKVISSDLKHRGHLFFTKL